MAAPGFLLASFPAALFVVILTKLIYNYWDRRSKPFPPGPKPKFLINNLLDLPKANSAQVFTEWGKIYNSTFFYLLSIPQHTKLITGKTKKKKKL